MAAIALFLKVSEIFKISRVNSGSVSPGPNISAKIILNFGIINVIKIGNTMNRKNQTML